MVEVGKVYSVKAPDGAGWFTGYKMLDVTIDFICSSISDGFAHFDFINYENGEVPEGKVQGNSSFVLHVDEISTKNFVVNEMLTRKFLSHQIVKQIEQK